MFYLCFLIVLIISLKKTLCYFNTWQFICLYVESSLSMSQLWIWSIWIDSTPPHRFVICLPTVYWSINSAISHGFCSHHDDIRPSVSSFPVSLYCHYLSLYQLYSTLNFCSFYWHNEVPPVLCWQVLLMPGNGHLFTLSKNTPLLGLFFKLISLRLIGYKLWTK